MDHVDRIYNVLYKEKITNIFTLPSSEFEFINKRKVEQIINYNMVSREEIGAGISAGIYLGGGRPIIITQSSGIGNMLNVLSSLFSSYKIPLPILISRRGYTEDENVTHKPLGGNIFKIFNACGIPFVKIKKLFELEEKLKLSIRKSYKNKTPMGIFFSIKILKKIKNDFEIKYKERAKKTKFQIDNNTKEPKNTRYEILKYLSDYLGGKLIICNLGLTSRVMYEICDHPRNFYMLGSMGMTSSIGLGLALTTNKKVIVIDGDGSLLYSISSLSTISKLNPDNLIIIVLDNGIYDSTGGQITDAYNHIDLESVAKSLGFQNTYKAYSGEELVNLINKRKGLKFIHTIVKTKNRVTKAPRVPLLPNQIKKRFMDHIGEMI